MRPCTDNVQRRTGDVQTTQVTCPNTFSQKDRAKV